MRNVAIAVLVFFGLIWLFFSYIYVPNNTDASLEKNDVIAVKEVKKHVVDVADIKNLALLLNVEYLEEKEQVEQEQLPSTFDVIIELVVIYTSENNHKLRISTEARNEKKQFDMIVGDKLYDYTLSAINPNSAKLDNGIQEVTLSMFKTATISVTDLPKEVSDSL
ncbi:hypothetical protein GCM10009111_13180 [Colwellia asteriadis]|uniref:Uncharacterized protein n=1 Tax=Colwellia asteriadis TaxID=517723 RepID=A0ABN1L5N7_9GAMM